MTSTSLRNQCRYHPYYHGIVHSQCRVVKSLVILDSSLNIHNSESPLTHNTSHPRPLHAPVTLHPSTFIQSDIVDTLGHDVKHYADPTALSLIDSTISASPRGRATPRSPRKEDAAAAAAAAEAEAAAATEPEEGKDDAKSEIE